MNFLASAAVSSRFTAMTAKSSAAEIRGELVVQRQRFAARAAPRRPEIDEHDLAAIIGERDLLAVERLRGETRRLRAGFRRRRREGERQAEQKGVSQLHVRLPTPAILVIGNVPVP